MLYLDTSLLVALLTPELETERVRIWFRNRAGEVMAISPWEGAELSSALSGKIRSGQVAPTDRDRALAAYRGMLTANLVSLEIESRHFEVAERWCERQEIGLRSADALHLAVTAAVGATLCTLDRRLAAAGKTFGVATERV